jgi:hypothetical protein
MVSAGQFDLNGLNDPKKSRPEIGFEIVAKDWTPGSAGQTAAVPPRTFRTTVLSLMEAL